MSVKETANHFIKGFDKKARAFVSKFKLDVIIDVLFVLYLLEEEIAEVCQ